MSTNSRPDHVHVERMFIEWEKEEELDVYGLPMSPTDWYETPQQGWQYWQTIPCLIILGEPGSGKTREFEQQVAELEAAGEYVHLTQWTGLLDDNEELWDSIKEKKNIFEEALSVGKTVWWFIDAIDEGKAKFTYAFDKLRKALRYLKDKNISVSLKLRLSCRIRDWQEIDESYLQEFFPSINDASTVKILKLLPLQQSGILKLAQEKFKDEKEAKIFFDLSIAKKVLPLASQPLTLNFMLNGYMENKTLSLERMTLYEHSVNKLALENNKYNKQGRHRITDEENRIEIAEQLAFIIVFSRLESTYIADYDEANPDSLNALKIETNKDKLQETLNTALFKGSSHRTFTFIHRSIGEFLAARFISNKIEKKELNLRHVLVLFSPQNEIIPSPLREVAAWLAMFQPKFRQWLVEIDPITASLADSSNYSAEECGFLITRLAEKLKDIPCLYHNLNLDNLENLAYSVKAKVLLNLLRPTSTEAEHLLAISLIYTAKRGELYEVLFNKINDPNLNTYVRVRLIKAIGSLSPQKYASKLSPLVILPAKQDPDDEIAGAVLSTLYPTHIDTTQALKGLRFPRSGLHGSLKSFWTKKFFQRIPAKDRPPALNSIVALFANSTTEHYIEDEFRILFLQLLLLELEKSTIYSEKICEWIDSYTHLLRSVNQTSEKNLHNKLMEQIETLSDLKYALIQWKFINWPVDKEINLVRDFPYRTHEYNTSTDFDMYINIFQQYIEYPIIAQFFIAQAKNNLWNFPENFESKLMKLEKIAEVYPLYQQYILPFICFLDSSEAIFYREFAEEEKQRKALKMQNILKASEKARSCLPLIRQGDVNQISLVIHELHVPIDITVTALLDKTYEVFGNEVARALEEGLIYNWDHPSDVSSLCSKYSSIPRPILLSNFGLNLILVKGNLNWLNCSREQINMACWIALHLFDMPAWFTSLWLAYPLEIGGKVKDLLEAESMNKAVFPPVWHKIFNNYYRADFFLEVFQEYFLTLNVPVNKEALKYYIQFSLILPRSIVIPKIEEAFSSYWKISNSSEEIEEIAMMLLAALWLLAPECAINLLKKVAKSPRKKRRIVIFMNSLHRLANNQSYYGLPKNIAWESWSLLFPFLYSSELNKIKPISSGFIDQEQASLRIRENFIEVLASGPPRAAYEFFSKIRCQRKYNIHQDILDSKYTELAQRLADDEWSCPAPDDLIAIIEKQAFLIKKEFDLYNFVCETIEEKLPDVLRSDISLVPEAWEAEKGTHKHEHAPQKAICAHLMSLLQNQPILHAKEPQVFNAKEPDICIYSIVGNNQKIYLPIEVKWSDHNKLEESIEHQLIMKYAQNPSINYGIYLVAWTGKKSRKYKSLEALQEKLRNIADDCYKRLRKKVSVFVLDFSIDLD